MSKRSLSLFSWIASLVISVFLGAGILSAEQNHVILCGGPALRKWEDYRVKGDQHDRWWANFIRASTLRMAEVRKSYGSDAKITWIVYRPGYVARSSEDGKPYAKWIKNLAVKRNVTLRWFSTAQGAINAINNHPSKSVISFDFFGHSNKYCFLLDYSSHIIGSSKVWIHENELSLINRDVFNKNAHCQSWGCHTGESMSAFWKKALGTTLIGVRGKTNYEFVGQGKMPVTNGTWIY